MTTSKPPDGPDVLTFYALGDWGTGDASQRRVGKALAIELDSLAPGRRVAPFVLGLGDNVYQKGLVPEGQ